MPPVNEVPEASSTVVLRRFRLASLRIEAVLWATLGLVFGVLAERHLVSSGRHVARPRFTI